MKAKYIMWIPVLGILMMEFASIEKDSWPGPAGFVGSALWQAVSVIGLILLVSHKINKYGR